MATNLAIALSELGPRVLLIDADMRRPRLHKLFEASADSGLATYLAGEEDWRHMAVTTRNGLDVLVCGPVPPNPAELLSSHRAQTLLEETLQEYKYVVLDSPPLLNVADARILASFVEGVVLVVKCGATPRVLLQRAESCVRSVGANIVGVVLNKFDFSDYSYVRYYRSDYNASKL